MRSGRFAQTSDAPERSLVTRLGGDRSERADSELREQESGHSPIYYRPLVRDTLWEHARFDRPVPGEQCEPQEIGAGREELLQVLDHRPELQDGGCRNPFCGPGGDVGSIRLIYMYTRDAQVPYQEGGGLSGCRDGGY